MTKEFNEKKTADDCIQFRYGTDLFQLKKINTGCNDTIE